MLITDFSNQNIEAHKENSSVPALEIIAAGMIFVLPIIFLLVVSAG